MTVGDAVDRHRLVVCVGTGGVGKTTIAAALALGAARRGRRVMVITIDPARQLACALGLDGLRADGQRVPAGALHAAGLPPDLALDAGMLDQKAAWDAFIARHAPTGELRARILANPFYRRLSTSFSGSTEYMAIEEMCRLDETGRYDLIVLDTPPASHALDFLDAPERIDRLLDRGLSSWLTRPYEAAGRGAWRAVGATASLVVRRLERAAGRSTLRDISAFFVALDGLLDDVARRTRTARGLLRSPGAGLVLVASPQPLVLAHTETIAARMRALGTPLCAVVLNRVAPAIGVPAADAAPVLDALARAGASPAAVDWLRHEWLAAVAEAAAQDAHRRRFEATLPPDLPRAAIVESDRDAHALADLATIADALWA